MRVYLEGIGVLGPGLAGWTAAKPVLAGEAAFVPGEVVLPPIAALPPAERRRTGGTVRLSVAVGLEALAQAGRAACDMATVFASSGGDGDTIHEILTVLATEQREISPTRFHNSVHNAPSGYWALACAATAPSTSLCGFDGSFATGLLDAAVQANIDARPVTLIAYDTPYPEPLRAARRVTGSFGVGLVLSPQDSGRSLATLDITLRHGNASGTVFEDTALDELRRGNPAARSLPLLVALARGGGRIGIEGIAGSLVEIDTVMA